MPPPKKSLKMKIRGGHDKAKYSIYIFLIFEAPDYMNIEMGIGDQILMKAISKASGRSVQQIRESNNVIGDLGEVA
jgi:DNA ligase 1